MLPWSWEWSEVHDVSLCITSLVGFRLFYTWKEPTAIFFPCYNLLALSSSVQTVLWTLRIVLCALKCIWCWNVKSNSSLNISKGQSYWSKIHTAYTFFDCFFSFFSFSFFIFFVNLNGILQCIHNAAFKICKEKYNFVLQELTRMMMFASSIYNSWMIKKNTWKWLWYFLRKGPRQVVIHIFSLFSVTLRFQEHVWVKSFSGLNERWGLGTASLQPGLNDAAAATDEGLLLLRLKRNTLAATAIKHIKHTMLDKEECSADMLYYLGVGLWWTSCVLPHWGYSNDIL